MTNWKRLGELAREQFDRFITGDRSREFRYWLRYLIDLPYTWGEENLFGVDCSGTISWALLRMGYNIRTTADGLFRKVFTTPVRDYDLKYSDTYAVFFLDDSGTAKHVAPGMGEGVVLDATPSGLRLLPVSVVKTIFETNYGKIPITRQINWQHARIVSESDRESWGVDPVLGELEEK